MAKKKQQLFDNKRVMYVYIALFVIATVYVGALVYWSVAYNNRIYPGVKIAGVEVGGKTKEEAVEVVTKKIQNRKAMIVVKGEGEYAISDKDLVLSYDIPKTVEEALEIGKEDNVNPVKRFHEDIPVELSLNEDVLSDKIDEIAVEEDKVVANADISLVKGKVVTSKEQVGKKVLYTENVAGLKGALKSLQSDYALKIKTVEPEITESEIKSAESEVSETLKKQITLKNGSKGFPVSKADILSFVSFSGGAGQMRSLVLAPDLSSVFPVPEFGNNVKIIFDRAKIRNWVLTFSKKVDTEAKNAKLAGSAGKVIVVADSVDGVKVQTDELTNKVKSALEEGQTEVTIPTQVTKATVAGDNLDKLGLKELISTGWTDFSGSPVNRRHNVATGASKFNGVLIKPGEDFSFNNTLGPVEASTGYLPELVILDDKTVPQYGGGLCQVSSTAFRAALNAGLPIISRLAHAYPVGYYKPYGVDATIYLPSPDLIFENDTAGYILVQTRVSGNRLYFDFYGTKKPVTIKFAGNKEGTVGVSANVEGITPTITDQEARGKGSFTATFYRLMYDASGKLIKTNWWVSKYDSPDKYPH